MDAATLKTLEVIGNNMLLASSITLVILCLMVLVLMALHSRLIGTRHEWILELGFNVTLYGVVGSGTLLMVAAFILMATSGM